MGHKFAEIAFTNAVKEIQRDKRSRDNYARMEQGEDFNHLISPSEAQFIGERDSFYMASVSETGWPYLQHRGGPAGFMKVIDTETIGFADYSGNRQYISTGNFGDNDRVALFFMDYPNRRRLKLLGRVRVIDSKTTGHDATALLNQLKPENYRAKIERGFVIHVEAFDWNCPQHITPRYTEEDINSIIEQRKASEPTLASEPTPTSDATTPESFGDGPLALTVTGIRQLTPRVRAYEFRSTTGQPLPEITAGSHLSIPIKLADGSKSHRHYSICSNPARRDIYEIAVLNKEGGSGGSLAIHQRFQLGTVIQCEYPQNYFDTTLEKQQPVILIAAGIGITPIKAIAQFLINKGHPVHLHYAGRSLKEMAFADRLQRSLGDNIQLYPADNNQRLNIQQLMQQAPKNAVFYACGPEKLLKEITATATSLDIPCDNIRLERFTPITESSDTPITVTVESAAQAAQVIEVGAQETILDALLSAGIDTNYSCKTGQCKHCAVELMAGEPDHRDTVLSEPEKQKLFCPCVSRANSTKLTIRI